MKNCEKTLLIIFKIFIILFLISLYLTYLSEEDSKYYYNLYIEEKNKNDELESKNISLEDELDNIKIDVKDLEEEINDLTKKK